MSENKYFILYLTRSGKERLGFSEDSFSVWDYSNDEEATKLDGRLWYKARRAYKDENVYIQVRHDEIHSIKEISIPIDTDTDVSIDDDSSDCFIATACSANSYELETLYQFRDSCLANFNLGRKFIEFYYIFSPRIANAIKSSDILRIFTLKLFVKPLVFTINLFMKRT